MHKELSESLAKKESLLVGGYSKDAYIEEVVQYILDRYQKKIYREKALVPPPAKKTRLTPFENRTETTSINRCAVCIILPNAGLIAEIASRIIQNKSMLGKEALKSSQYSITGDDSDDFLLPLKYTEEEGFEETTNLQADIVITTTKALVTMGDKRIDRKKHFINEKEELVDFKRKIKHEMNVYAFLSGVDTTILVDADILQIQNEIALEESVKIIEESKPAPKEQLNLRYISSGEEKKAFIFLANIITPKIASMVSMLPNHKIVSKPVDKPVKIGYSMCIKIDQSTEINTYTDHHITNLSEKYEKILVVVKDSVELKGIEEEIKNNSLMGAHRIFFVDEYTPKNKIKEELESKKKRVWVITERFIFYRKKRLPRIITPYDPVKIFSPHIVNPRILKILAKTVDPQETKCSEYSCPVIMRAEHTTDEYFLSELFGQKVTIEELFAYSDNAVIKEKG